MFAAGFEPAIPTKEQPQTHALDRAATGIIKGIRNFNIRRCQVGEMGKVLLNQTLIYIHFTHSHPKCTHSGLMKLYGSKNIGRGIPPPTLPLPPRYAYGREYRTPK